VTSNALAIGPNGVPAIALAASEGFADRRDLALIAVERTRMPMAVSDPRLSDNPIVLANRAFLDLCGYEAEEIVGRNCRFLQGPETDPQAIAQLRAAVKGGREIELELLNYRKDGSSFWNKVFVSPIHNEAGELIYFFASQKDETAKRRAIHLEEIERRLLREVDHRTKNALALVQSVVLLSQRSDIESFAASIEGRVGSIVKSHVLLADHDWGEVPIARVFESESSEIDEGVVTLAGPHATIPALLVQPLALIIHEIFDNALKHGAISTSTGKMDVCWTSDRPQRGIVIKIGESGGPAPDDQRKTGLGLRLIERIIGQQLGGTAKFDYADTGLRTTLSIPTI
jgi:PAS domain S-box-containing protein